MDHKIANFWARIVAILIDFSILGVFGFILGIIFGDFFVSLGNHGLLVGFIISWLYFSILNSKIGGGQTFGKKIFKIHVISGNGSLIDLKTSFLRSAVLIIPYFFINYNIPGLSTFSILSIIKTHILLYAFTGLIVIYIFNKFTRQSLHDIVSKTYVTNKDKSDVIFELHPIKKYVYIIQLGVIVLIIALNVFLGITFTSGSFGNLTNAYQEIKEIDGVINASVGENTTTFTSRNGTSTSRSLTINVYAKELPNSNEELESSKMLKDVLYVIFRDYNDLDQFDRITFQITRGYNIGIAKSHSYKSISKSPKEWQEIYYR